MDCTEVNKLIEKKARIAIAMFIRRERQRKGWSVQTLANKLNLSHAMVTYLENGENKASPKLSTIFKVANAFGRTPREMFDMLLEEYYK